MFCWYNQNESKKGFSQFHLLWIAKLSANNVIRMLCVSIFFFVSFLGWYIHFLNTGFIFVYHKTCSKTDRESSMNFMPNFDQPTKINLAMLSVCLVYLIFNALKVCKVWCLEIQKQIHSTISCYFNFVFIVKSSTKFRL